MIFFKEYFQDPRGQTFIDPEEMFRDEGWLETLA